MPCPGCSKAGSGWQGVMLCPFVRCQLRVPSSAALSPWWHSRCSLCCLSDGMLCLCWRAGLAATSRSPAQCRKLTRFITMGVGWQGSETTRRSVSGVRMAHENRWAVTWLGTAAWKRAWAKGRQELGDQRVPMLSSTSWAAGAAPRSTGVNKGLLTDLSHMVWVPRREGIWGKSMFTEYTFFLGV